ncbi:hypothetical protein HanXRQr2_Chr16g0765911 [Helianthus annuus]|uniref:Uncharacterized protein n=1 Tax=Helianthus annuus TaxID=4232 RepID=A0A251S1F9_HELAN|nr:hypothetical protein HanXRQr2_Chr16g0765911 [Helianthus annuus]KAJ0439352.1 hypothetical protein HanHA300_Chr16g0624361 [Helianthus annuus]KAJ0461701.1 hypothetical protein HanHA89_Chr16g0675271 [Helianthus annuus]KAJ0822609.1 hypothetical protein HanPSC8_Chr16g0734071 [Helianthus annuus]
MRVVDNEADVQPQVVCGVQQGSVEVGGGVSLGDKRLVVNSKPDSCDATRGSDVDNAGKGICVVRDVGEIAADCEQPVDKEVDVRPRVVPVVQQRSDSVVRPRVVCGLDAPKVGGRWSRPQSRHY